jgi:endonuclease/exonuclease/phosphatase (EEP) superfamily protein YafD
MQTVAQVVGSLMVLFTFLSLVRSHYWWIRIFDFPRTQIATVIVAIFGLYLYFYEINHWLHYTFLCMLGIAVLVQTWFIYPFTRLAPIKAIREIKPDPSRSIRLMIANVRMDNKRTKGFIDIVKKQNPDLLLVNEPNQWWADQLKELGKIFPYSIKKPLENTYGMMLFSKLELVDGDVHFLVEEDIPSIHTLVKLRSGEKIKFFGVHPKPPAFLEHTDEREAELLIVGKLIKQAKQACIVAGDLNDVGWSRTTKLFQRISGTIDPRVGRGFYNTYSVFFPFFRYPLDHVFYDPAFRLLAMQRLQKYGSDHFPICVDLTYMPQGEHEQEIELADKADKKEAEELIQKGLDED